MIKQLLTFICTLTLLCHCGLAQDADTKPLSDSAIFLARVKVPAALYASPSYSSEEVKKFEIDHLLAVVSYVQEAGSSFDYLKVVSDTTVGYVMVNEVTILEEQLDFLKSRGAEGEAIRMDKARRIAIHLELERLEAYMAKMKRYTRQGLVVTDWSYTEPDEVVGGVDVDMQILNPSPKTIKYVWFTLTAYNPVGDRVVDRISGTGSKTVKGIGPVKQWNEAKWSFEHTWYNGTIDCVRISQIKVQYMDGSVRLFTTPSTIMVEGQSNSCSY